MLWGLAANAAKLQVLDPAVIWNNDEDHGHGHDDDDPILAIYNGLHPEMSRTQMTGGGEGIQDNVEVGDNAEDAGGDGKADG